MGADRLIILFVNYFQQKGNRIVFFHIYKSVHTILLLHVLFVFIGQHSRDTVI